MQARNMNLQQLYNIFTEKNMFINPFGATVQCALESSSNGKPFNSGLAVQANNLAGIKAVKESTPHILKNTWEENNNGKYQTTARFRKWDSVELFAKDFSDTIHRLYPSCSKDNFLGYFSGLNKNIYGSGWATDKLYFDKLLKLAWNCSDEFFSDPKMKWKAALVYACDHKLFVSEEHERKAVQFVKDVVLK